MSLVREKAAEARSSLGQDENALALSFVMKDAVGKSVLKSRTISKISNPKYGPCTRSLLFLCKQKKCCIHATVIDRQNGFLEPIREEIPCLLRNQLLGSKHVIVSYTGNILTERVTHLQLTNDHMEQTTNNLCLLDLTYSPFSIRVFLEAQILSLWVLPAAKPRRSTKSPPREQGPHAMEGPQTQSNWLYVRETTQAPSTQTPLPVLYGPGETQTTTPLLKRVLQNVCWLSASTRNRHQGGGVGVLQLTVGPREIRTSEPENIPHH